MTAGRGRAGGHRPGGRADRRRRARRCPGPSTPCALCRRLALPVAVCSGSYAVVIEAALRPAGDRVRRWPRGTRPNGSRWASPIPGAYLSTAAKLGVDPTGCLAVEDSFNGAISAKAARMRVVAVPEPAAARLAALGVLRRRAPVPHRLRRGRCSARSRGRPADASEADLRGGVQRPKLSLRKAAQDADTAGTRGIPWAGGTERRGPDTGGRPVGPRRPGPVARGR